MAKKTKDQVPANYLESIPHRGSAYAWKEREDGIVEIEMENKGFYNSIAQKFFKKPRVSYIALDVYGSAVWKLVDGKNNVLDVVHGMENAFPDEKDRMMDRVVTFMATLQSNGFVTIQEVK